MMNRSILSSSTEPAPPPVLDDDNLLAEILLRLPSLPSSLTRAALVCKRWRRLVSDPHFLRSFHSHHQKPPLLGFLYDDDLNRSTGFISVLDSPDRIPAPHFSGKLSAPPKSPGKLSARPKILDCHHGLVLTLFWGEELSFNETCGDELLHVWNPVTRDHRYVALPPAFTDISFSVRGGVVFCAAKDQGHVHGACHPDPFKVVLVSQKIKCVCVSVYSSDTGAWGNIISLPFPDVGGGGVYTGCSGILSGNSVCWLAIVGKVKILQFGLDEQNLAFIDVPLHVADSNTRFLGECQFSITPADSNSSGDLNFIVLKAFTIHVWKRMSSGNGVPRWMLGNTIELSNLLSLGPSRFIVPLWILAVHEDGNAIFKLADGGVIVMVHLVTKQFKKLTERATNLLFVPYASFYTAGM